MLLASFVVGIRCSGAITGERERQTWEAVLLTPMSAKQLVAGNCGSYGSVLLVFVGLCGAGRAVSALGGVGCLGWTVLWLAVTVLAMYYMGAVAFGVRRGRNRHGGVYWGQWRWAISSVWPSIYWTPFPFPS